MASWFGFCLAVCGIDKLWCVYRLLNCLVYLSAEFDVYFCSEWERLGIWEILYSISGCWVQCFFGY